MMRSLAFVFVLLLSFKPAQANCRQAYEDKVEDLSKSCWSFLSSICPTPGSLALYQKAMILIIDSQGYTRVGQGMPESVSFLSDYFHDLYGGPFGLAGIIRYANETRALCPEGEPLDYLEIIEEIPNWYQQLKSKENSQFPTAKY